MKSYSEMKAERVGAVDDRPIDDTPRLSFAERKAAIMERDGTKAGAGPVSKTIDEVRRLGQEKIKETEPKNQEMMNWLKTADWENITPEEWAAHQDKPVSEVIRGVKGYIGATKKAYSLASLGVDESRIGSKFLKKTATREDAAKLREIRIQARALQEDLKDAPYEAEAFGTLAPFLVESAREGGKGYFIGYGIGAVSAWLAGKAAPGPEEVVTVPAVGKIAGRAGKAMAALFTLENMREIEAGQFFLRAIDDGIDPTVARITADAYGGASTLLETAQWTLLGKIIPGSKKITGEILEETMKRVFKNKYARATAGTAVGIGGEAGVEATQQLTENIMITLGQVATDFFTGTDFAPETIEEYKKQLVEGVGETFAKTGVGFAIPGGVGLAVKTGGLAVENVGARQRANAVLDQMAKDNEKRGTAKKTKVKKPLVTRGAKPDKALPEEKSKKGVRAKEVEEGQELDKQAKTTDLPKKPERP
ncbi:MAG: hypothetical protein ACXABY_22340, partial [Candidatus Thorarchaeota archaeon]